MEDSLLLQSISEDVIVDPSKILNPRSVQPMNETKPSVGEEKTCSTCASKTNGSLQYVYSIGKIKPRFPSLGIEKEFTQAVGRIKTDGLTDNAVMFKILSDPQYLYLARKLCWTLSIEGLETYLLQPMHSADLEMLVDSLKPTPDANDINVVIGILGPIASPNYCSGLQLPIIGFSQIYSFDVPSLIESIPNNNRTKNFSAIAEELFMRIMQMTDNAGATDDHRALNYLAVRYHGVYATSADCYERDFSLTGVLLKPAALNGIRKMVDVIFTFSNRSTDVIEKYYCRVDVSEEFPFLVAKMQAYLDR
jgi:hypothetical protein